LPFKSKANKFPSPHPTRATRLSSRSPQNTASVAYILRSGAARPFLKSNSLTVLSAEPVTRSPESVDCIKLTEPWCSWADWTTFN
jgi:hypothetical protein